MRVLKKILMNSFIRDYNGNLIRRFEKMTAHKTYKYVITR